MGLHVVSNTLVDSMTKSYTRGTHCSKFMAKGHDGTKVRVIIGKIQLLKGVAGIALKQHAPQLLLANIIKVIVSHLKIAQSGVGHKPLR